MQDDMIISNVYFSNSAAMQGISPTKHNGSVNLPFLLDFSYFHQANLCKTE